RLLLFLLNLLGSSIFGILGLLRGSLLGLSSLFGSSILQLLCALGNLGSLVTNPLSGILKSALDVLDSTLGVVSAGRIGGLLNRSTELFLDIIHGWSLLLDRFDNLRGLFLDGVDDLRSRDLGILDLFLDDLLVEGMVGMVVVVDGIL